MRSQCFEISMIIMMIKLVIETIKRRVMMKETKHKVRRSLSSPSSIIHIKKDRKVFCHALSLSFFSISIFPLLSFLFLCFFLPFLFFLVFFSFLPAASAPPFKQYLAFGIVVSIHSLRNDILPNPLGIPDFNQK